jgi:hypothetical protein
MSKAVRTILSPVVSLVLFSTAALAHAGGDNTDKDKNKNKEHHSRISKLAFWHHHRHDDKRAKTAHAKQEHHSRISTLAFWRHRWDNDKSAKTVQAKQVQPKQPQVKVAQAKPAPATLAAGKKGGKPEQHARSKARTNKSSAIKTKPREKAQDHTTASLKQ